MPQGLRDAELMSREMGNPGESSLLSLHIYLVEDYQLLFSQQQHTQLIVLF